MLTEIRSFSDPQHHASSIQGWEQVYDQQSCGSFNSELRQVATDHFQIFQETLGKRVVQHGRSPKGRLCIALLVSLDRPPLVCGQKVGAHNIVLLRDGEEFLLHAPEGLCFLGANVDLVRFARLAAFELSDEKLGLLKTMPQIALAEPVLQRVRQCIYPIFQCLLQRTEPVNAAVEKMLEDSLLDAFLDLFSNASSEGRDRRGCSAVCAYLVKRSQELAMAQGDAPISIIDLCEHLRVSRRTLQNSFQVITGTRPVEYLRNLRLNAVRRRLIGTSASQLKVGEAAAEMGFYHLSHFASHYRVLFGECPSETKRA